MSNEAWNDPSCAAWACSSSAAKIDVDEHGEPIVGDTMLLLFNADHANTIPFTFPKPDDGEPWELVFDTARPNPMTPPEVGDLRARPGLGRHAPLETAGAGGEVR